MTKGQGRARRIRLTLVAAALLLPALVAPASAEFTAPPLPPGKDGVNYEWWDPDGSGPLAWHFRVPVMVRPRIADTLTPAEWSSIDGVKNFPVKLEIDFSDVVRRMGEDGKSPAWPRDPLGRLSSFTFDPKSVRVVAYSYDSGRIEKTLGDGGVLSSMFLPGLLDNPDKRTATFNASTNAVGTVFYVHPGTWVNQQLVFVYFDSVENGAKPAQTNDPVMQGILDGLHWTRSGTTFFGYLPDRASSNPKQPALRVVALYDNTTVRVQSYGRFAGLPPTDVPRCEIVTDANVCTTGGRVNAKTGSLLPNLGVSRGQSLWLDVYPATPEAFYFRIDATKPVLVALGTPMANSDDAATVWYPATDGGLVGTEFRVPGLGNPYDCGTPQCTAPYKPNNLRLINTQNRDVLVTVSDHLSPTTPSDSYSIPPGGTAVLDVNNRITYRLGGLLRVVSTGLIAVAGVGYSDPVGVQGITPFGSPVGRQLIVPVSTLTVANSYGATDAYMFDFERNSNRLPIEGVRKLTATGADTSWTQAHQGHSLRTDIWMVASSNADMTVLGGAQGLFPFGGREAGTDFRVSFHRHVNSQGGYGMIVPLYDDTLVTIENLNTGKTLLTKTLGVDDIFLKRSTDPGVALLSAQDPGRATTFRVTASKPIVIYNIQEPSTGIYGTMLAGKLASPDYVIGTGSFFGCVVGWNPKDKAQSQTVTPGQEVSFAFRVLNLGRDVGGGATKDNISIALRREGGEATRAWKLTLSTTLVRELPSGEESRVTLTVQVPSTASTGDTLEAFLLARSGCNPLMRDEAGGRITVQTRYDFDMTFENGRKTTTRSVSPEDAEARFPIRVRNLGTGNDSINFTLGKAAGDRFGFKARLVDADGRDLVGAEGSPVAPLVVGVGATRTITLLITPPPTAEALPEIPYVVEGTSGRDSSVRDQVTATILLNAQTKIRLEAANLTLTVSPGRDAVFNLTLVNLGEASDVDLSVVAALRTFPGWNVSLGCATCRRDESGNLVAALGSAGSAAERVRFNVTVSAAPAAIVDTILSVKVVAVAGQGDAESLALTARVTNNFKLEVFEGPPRTATLDGTPLDIDLLVTSRANGPVSIDVVAASMPAGWSLVGRTVPEPPVLAPGAVATIGADVRLRPNAPPGAYDVALGLVLVDIATGDRFVEVVYVAVNVPRSIAFDIEAPADLQAAPGGTVRVPLVVKNVGNAPAEVDVLLAAPSGWTSTLVDALTSRLSLAPGDARFANFTVKAPAAPTGPATFTATARVPLEAEKSTPVVVGVLRRDLAVVSVTALTESFREGQTAVFEVAVRNNGTLPAANVEVALVVDGAVARNFTIRSLPAGESRAFPLVWTVTPSKEVVVVVDPRERHADENRANNAFTFSLEGKEGGGVFAKLLPTPGPAALLALAALGAVAAALRRWRA